MLNGCAIPQRMLLQFTCSLFLGYQLIYLHFCCWPPDEPASFYFTAASSTLNALWRMLLNRQWCILSLGYQFVLPALCCWQPRDPAYFYFMVFNRQRMPSSHVSSDNDGFHLYFTKIFAAGCFTILLCKAKPKGSICSLVK